MQTNWIMAIGISVLTVLFSMPERASALKTINLDSAGNGFVVGMAGGTAWICWRDTDGRERLWNLRTSGTGPLNDNVVINTLGGSDGGLLVQVSSYAPSTWNDCGITSWNPLEYNGFYLDIRGGDGNDVLQGAIGSGDTRLFGDADNDIMYQYSSIGHLDGGAGNDDLVSDAGSPGMGFTQVRKADLDRDRRHVRDLRPNALLPRHARLRPACRRSLGQPPSRHMFTMRQPVLSWGLVLHV